MKLKIVNNFSTNHLFFVAGGFLHFKTERSTEATTELKSQ